MATMDAEDMDSANNNTMSNNNNSSNINNNAVPSSVGLSSACTDPGSPCSNTDGTGVVPAPTVSNVDATSSTSNSRSRSSRRSRSSGRSRSRRRHSQSSGRRGSRHHSRQNHKRRERNFPSALCSMISIVILCTALAEPSWIRIDNGHCSQLSSSSGGPPYRLESLRYLGALQFFYFGSMVSHDPNLDPIKVTVVTEYRNGPEVTDRLVNCVTERVVMIFKIVIALTFLAILTSLISFSLDLVGLEHRLFKLLRRSAVFNIFTVLVCVGIITFLYWATVDVLDLQHNPGISDKEDVTVTFDVSFYLITAAGACSVIAVAFNCLRRKVVDAEPVLARTILDDQFNVDTENLLVIPPPSLQGHDFSPMSNLPPPPPYTPY